MRIVLIVSALVATALTDSQISEEELSTQWNQFKATYRKNYNSSPYELRRRAVFRKNWASIQAHNVKYEEGTTSFYMKINKFSDLTTDEIATGFKASAGDSSADDSTTENTDPSITFNLPVDTPIPDNMDWRIKGAVTPIKDQGKCGSCWSFSATGSLEGQHFLKTNDLVALSEQQLIDCVATDFGCNGGLMNDAFAYLKQNNPSYSEDSYKYLGLQFACSNKSEKVGTVLSDYVGIPPSDETQLLLALATVGPISVPVSVTDEFRHYGGGVYDTEACGHGENAMTNHAVTLVGYGTHWTGQKVWLLKNQWGKDWGLRGYMLLARGKDNLCGITQFASFPIISA